MGMWMAGGVDEADRLDKAATKHLLTRVWRMLQPYRRDLIAALGMVVLWTATTLAGPFLVRHGIDQGIKEEDAAALDAAVIGYVVVAAISYVTYRFQVKLISRIGESFLRDVRIRWAATETTSQPTSRSKSFFTASIALARPSWVSSPERIRASCGISRHAMVFSGEVA